MKSNKLCKYCGGTNHTSLMCFKKTKIQSVDKIKQYQLKRKIDMKWVATRHTWIQDHPPISGGYSCHYCKHFVPLEELTLDHKTPRSGLGVTKKYDQDNLVACCAECNVLKGSMQYETFIKHHFPYLDRA
jgi:5-methylcytosine-specific restriction endonuclease McrA